MSTEQLTELWKIVRENEKTIAVLSSRVEAGCTEIAKLRDDNERIKTIIDRAIGAKTFAGVVGAIVGALFAALVTWYCSRLGVQK